MEPWKTTVAQAMFNITFFKDKQKQQQKRCEKKRWAKKSGCQVRHLTCSSRISKISFPTSSSMPWMPFIERAVSHWKCRKLSCHMLSEWRFPEKGKTGNKKGGGEVVRIYEMTWRHVILERLCILNSVLDLCFFWGWGFWYFRKWHSLPRWNRKIFVSPFFATKKESKCLESSHLAMLFSIKKISEFYPQGPSVIYSCRKEMSFVFWVLYFYKENPPRQHWSNQRVS